MRVNINNILPTYKFRSRKLSNITSLSSELDNVTKIIENSRNNIWTSTASAFKNNNTVAINVKKQAEIILKIYKTEKDSARSSLFLLSLHIQK